MNSDPYGKVVGVVCTLVTVDGYFGDLIPPTSIFSLSFWKDGFGMLTWNLPS